MIEASRRRRRIQIVVLGFIAVVIALSFQRVSGQSEGPRSRIGSEASPRRSQGGLAQVVNDAIAGIDPDAETEGDRSGEAQASESLRPSTNDGDGDVAGPETDLDESEVGGPTLIDTITGSSDGGLEPVTTNPSDESVATTGGAAVTTRSPASNASATATTRRPTTARPTTSRSSTTGSGVTTRPSLTTAAPTVTATTTPPTTKPPTTGTAPTTAAPTTAPTTTPTIAPTTTSSLPPVDAVCALDVSIRSKLRAEPRASADEVGTVRRGVYTVLDRSGRWYQISGSDAVGWVTKHPRRQPVGNCD